MDSDEEEIIYSDAESQSDSNNCEERVWGIDWDNMVCIDEYGEDGDTHANRSDESSCDEEFDELELDAVDELDDISSSSPSKEKQIGERRARSDDDKNESDEKEEEGDPWSRWVGKEDGEEKERKEKERKREETRREERRDGSRRDEKREERKMTMAEMVLKGMVKEGEATRDKRSRILGRSPPRRDERKKRSSSPSRRSIPSHPMRMEKRRSPGREGRRISPSHDRRRERSPRRIASPILKKEKIEKSMERRRDGSPLRMERRSSPSRREKRLPERKEERRRMERSPDRRNEGGRRREGEIHRGHSPSRELIRRDRSSLPSKRDPIPSIHPTHPIHSRHRVSSPNRTIVRRSRSPLGGKREETHRRISPNRMKIEERTRKENSPRREEGRRVRSRSPIVIPRKELPSLLDVNILAPHSRMEGRVKREEKKDEMKDKEKERPKERIVSDGREMKIEKKEDTKREERKRHVPIVWNDAETDAKKLHRSFGHVEGIDAIERKRKEEEKNEERRIEKMRVVGDAIIPSSMAARVGKSSSNVIDNPRSIVLPPKYDGEVKKSLEPISQSLQFVQKEQQMKKSLDSHPRLQPIEVVRTIVNKDVVTKQPDQRKEKKIMQLEEEEEEEGEIRREEDDEDEGGWLSTRLQVGGNGIPMESSLRTERKMADPSSAALRMLGRATASAVSSSTMMDARPAMRKEMRRPIEAPDSSVEKKGGRNGIKKIKRLMDDRIEMRSVNDVIVNKKDKRRPANEAKEILSSSNLPRLLDVYY